MYSHEIARYSIDRSVHITMKFGLDCFQTIVKYNIFL